MKIALIGDSLTEGRPGVSFLPFLQQKHEKFPIENLGKAGETVKSLYKRLTELEEIETYDLSFIWIGVNDVFSKMLKVQAQPVVQNDLEFENCYEKVLESVLGFSKHVVLVTPALVGENPASAPNDRLKELAAVIQRIAKKHSNVTFLNLQSVFIKRLVTSESSEYVGTSMMKMMIEALFYKSHSKIDRLSDKRGLHYTLDGVHLNSKGAKLVADEYSAVIELILQSNKDKIYD